jgi:hypothetical protein
VCGEIRSNSAHIPSKLKRRFTENNPSKDIIKFRCLMQRNKQQKLLFISSARKSGKDKKVIYKIDELAMKANAIAA